MIHPSQSEMAISFPGMGAIEMKPVTIALLCATIIVQVAIPGKANGQSTGNMNDLTGGPGLPDFMKPKTTAPQPAAPALERAETDSVDDPKIVEAYKRAAEDAGRFTAAIGSIKALESYLAWCKDGCEFAADAHSMIKDLRDTEKLAAVEKTQFDSARGDVAKLRQYVKDCQVCTFAKQAVQGIGDVTAKYRESLFEFKVCNDDYLEVWVAVAGRTDPNSNMLIANGWQKVLSGECKTIGPFARGPFYYTAYSFKRRKHWPKDSQEFFCIPDERFSLLLYNGYECSGTRRGFAKVSVNDPEYKRKLNPVPWTYTALASPGNESPVWGWSGSRRSSREEAEDRAMQECWRRNVSAYDCRVLKWVRDDFCMAVATGRTAQNNSVWGWGSGEDADEKALDACQRRGGLGCTIEKDSCEKVSEP